MIGCFFVLFGSSVFLIQSLVADNSQIWTTQDEFNNMLPSTLTPMFETSATTSGECFTYCAMNGCSSVAFSEAYRSCKLYSHPNLPKPLPKLGPDTTGYTHQMYYKKKFCPSGWESDPTTGKCYLMDTTTQQRPSAWQVCEEHLMSELVMFQTPLQRDNLYQILDSKYSSVSKWWLGYASFGGLFWPRPVDEIPGYRSYRGDCPGNEIMNMIGTQQECASKCDRVYHDLCVGFVYDGIAGKCYLKRRMCRVNDNTKALGTEYWSYAKVGPGRPMATYTADAPGYDINSYLDVSQMQCRSYMASFLDGVHVAYWPSNRSCVVHRQSAIIKSGCGGCVSWDSSDINEGWCPYGIRFRDVCLLILPSTTQGTYTVIKQWCNTMGGILPRPTDAKRKASYLYSVGDTVEISFFVDFLDPNSNFQYWQTIYTGQQLTDSVYDRWPWKSGEPSNGTNKYYVVGSTRQADATGTTIALETVIAMSTGNYVCELPLSQSYPKNCRFTPYGREYMGTLSKTTSGALCKDWSNMSTYTNNNMWRNFPDWYVAHAYCRHPSSLVPSLSCYRQDNGVVEACDVPMCPETDWASVIPDSQFDNADDKIYSAITREATQPDFYWWTLENPQTGTANALCQINMNDWCRYYFRGSCYQLYQIPNSHAEAKAICSQNGWHLATITSMDEQKFMIGVTQRLGHQYGAQMKGYHIGLYWSTTDSNWAWETGETFSPTPNLWEDGAPDATGSAYCGIIYSTSRGWWQTMDCSLKDWFICEIELAN